MDLADLKISTSEPKDLAELLSERSRTFAGPGADAQATVFRDSQLNLWRTLLGNPPSDQSIRTCYQRLIQSISQNIFALREAGRDKNRIVDSTIPLLTDAIVSILTDRTAKDPFLVAAAVLTECEAIIPVDQISQFISFRLMIAFNRYLNGGIPPKDFVRYFSDQKVQLNAQNSAIESFVSSKSQQFADFVASKTADLESFKKALNEAASINASSTLWKEKADRHRAGYLFWFVVFIVCAGIFVWYIASHEAEFFALMPRDKDGNLSYSGVIFFVVPAVAVGWALRIVGRFINVQQSLGDDARHRDAMTRTYLALVANKDAKLDEKDRVIMLSAIFRPLPGQQTEDVAPPTLLDLLQKK